MNSDRYFVKHGNQFGPNLKTPGTLYVQSHKLKKKKNISIFKKSQHY